MVKKIESKIVAYKVKAKEELEKQQEAEVVHRITSYNVCYTKLLRIWKG